MFGLFKIINIKDTQAYKLALLPHWKIHNIFHISLLEKVTLKKRRETDAMQLATIPPDNVDIEANNPEYVVNELIDSVIFEAGKVPGQSKSTAGLYYLVDWKDYKEFKRTWEPYKEISYLQRLIQHFHDKCFNKPNRQALVPTKVPTKQQFPALELRLTPSNTSKQLLRQSKQKRN